MYIVTFRLYGGTGNFGPFQTEKQAARFVDEKHAALAVFGFVCEVCHACMCGPDINVKGGRRCDYCQYTLDNEFLKVAPLISPQVPLVAPKSVKL